MRLMLAAPLAVLFQFQLRLDLLLVALAVVIDALADRALQTDKIILGHSGY